MQRFRPRLSFKKAMGSVITEYGLLISVIALGCLGGLFALNGGLTQFAQAVQNGGRGANGMATGNVPAPTIPNQAEMYNDGLSSASAGQTNTVANGGLYTWDGQTYIANKYTFGAGGAGQGTGGNGNQCLGANPPPSCTGGGWGG